MLYRGCKEANLKVMYPKLVNHKNKYVYATSDLVEAIIYSVKEGNFNYTNIYGYDDNNKRCLIERKKDCLEKIYNQEGRYYILDDKNFIKHKAIGIGDNEYISTKCVNVEKEITIPNVWEYLKQLEMKGALKIYRYPTRPKIYPLDDSDLIECAILEYLNTNNLDYAFIKLEKYHPELKEVINKTKEYIKTHSIEDVKASIKFFK